MSVYKSQALKKRWPDKEYCDGYEKIDWKAKPKKKKEYEMDELSKRILGI
jgi:hypothetical protein